MVFQFLQFEEVSHGVAVEEGLRTGAPVDVCVQTDTHTHTHTQILNRSFYHVEYKAQKGGSLPTNTIYHAELQIYYRSTTGGNSGKSYVVADFVLLSVVCRCTWTNTCRRKTNVRVYLASRKKF